MRQRVTQTFLGAAFVWSFIFLPVPRAQLAQTEAGGEPLESPRPQSEISDAGPQQPAKAAADSRVLSAFGRLPVSFIENRGQVDGRVRFHARRGGMTAFFTRDAFVLQLVRREGKSQESSTPQTITGASVFLSFEGALSDVVVEGVDQLPGRSNYFRGKDPSKWRTSVPGYSSIRYRGLYAGVDVVVKEQEGRFEYDLILEPGADLDQVVIRCEGAEALRIDASGALIVETAAGPIEQPRPQTYQIGLTGEHVPVDCSLRLLGESRFGFTVTGRDRDLPLVVDPGLVYSTFLGGSGRDAAYAIALDASGDAVVSGGTGSYDFPTTPGAYDTTTHGALDAFVTKLDPSGSTLLYSTFLGGSDDEEVFGLVLDTSGAAIVS